MQGAGEPLVRQPKGIPVTKSNIPTCSQIYGAPLIRGLSGKASTLSVSFPTFSTLSKSHQQSVAGLLHSWAGPPKLRRDRHRFSTRKKERLGVGWVWLKIVLRIVFHRENVLSKQQKINDTRVTFSPRPCPRSTPPKTGIDIIDIGHTNGRRLLQVKSHKLSL